MLWEIAPGRSRAEEPEHPVDDGAMVFVRSPSVGFLRGKEWPEVLPLLISEFMWCHPPAYDAFADTP